MKLNTLLRLPLLALALGVALVLALANRGSVRLSLDPFSTEAPMVAFELPLYMLIFVAILSGVLIGGVAAWFGQTGWRKKARRTAKEVRHLEKDIERQKAESEAHSVDTSDTPPEQPQKKSLPPG